MSLDKSAPAQATPDGAKVAIVATGASEAGVAAVGKTLRGGKSGLRVIAIPNDVPIDHAHSAELDALVILPAGNAGSSQQADAKVLQLVREFMLAEKPVVAIASGVMLLVAADVVAGRRIAAPSELAEKVSGAGADPTDRNIEIDEKLITVQSEGDLAAAVRELERVVGESGRLEAERAVDQFSEQSFPASDPPPGPSAIGASRRKQADGPTDKTRQ